MRGFHRVYNFCIYVLPTLCLLLMLFMYIRQRNFYEQKLKSIGKVQSYEDHFLGYLIYY